MVFFYYDIIPNMNKIFKRMIIVIFYLLVFSLVGTGFYYLLKPAETCSDGIKNQNEQGIDCGGRCAKKCEAEIIFKDLIVGKIGAVPSGINGQYDFYAKVKNPNDFYGSKKINYEIIFKDSAENIIASKKGFNFILPGEEKYVIETNINSSSEPVSFDFKIIDSDWIVFQGDYENPNILVAGKKYNEIVGGVGYFEATGLLKNESNFDFNAVKVKIILKNSNDDVLAINSTLLKGIAAGDNREFRVFWPNSFPGSVSGMDTQLEVNIFAEDVFFKKFYKSQAFQRY